MIHVVGLGEYVVSTDQEDIIKTFALSTCVGMTVYCPDRGIMAMAHIVLPDSSQNDRDEGLNPMKYADTAVPALFSTLAYRYGCTDRDRMHVKLFGAINPAKKDYFCIGNRNLNAVKKELKKLNICFDDQETGGRVCRTLIAKVYDGSVEVVSNPMRMYINQS